MTRAGPVADQPIATARELGRSLKKLDKETGGDGTDKGTPFEDVLSDVLPGLEPAGRPATAPEPRFALHATYTSWRLHGDADSFAGAAREADVGGTDARTGDTDDVSRAADTAVIEISGTIDLSRDAPAVMLTAQWNAPVAQLDAPSAPQTDVAHVAGIDPLARTDIREVMPERVAQEAASRKAPVLADGAKLGPGNGEPPGAPAPNPATRPTSPVAESKLGGTQAQAPHNEPVPNTSGEGPRTEASRPSQGDQPKRWPLGEETYRVAVTKSETFFGPVSQPPATLAGQIAAPMIAQASPSSEPAALPSPQPLSPSKAVLKVLHIELDPPSLGSLSVRMVLRDDTLSVVIQASDAATADLIRRDHEGLSKLLKSAGYELEDLAVDVLSASPAPAHSVQVRAFDQGGSQAHASAQPHSSSTPSDSGSSGPRYQHRHGDREAPAHTLGDPAGVADARAPGNGLYV